MKLAFPILKRLFFVPDGPRCWYQVIIWWELRRVLYNILVGFFGIISLCVFIYLASQRPKQFEDGPEPLAILFFGFAANLFYTGGWIGELIVRLLWRERAAFFGPIMFGVGLLFSIALCFLPPLIAALIWITT